MNDHGTRDRILADLDTLGIDGLKQVHAKAGDLIGAYDKRVKREVIAEIKRLAKEHGLTLHIDTERSKRGSRRNN